MLNLFNVIMFFVKFVCVWFFVVNMEKFEFFWICFFLFYVFWLCLIKVKVWCVDGGVGVFVLNECVMIEWCDDVCMKWDVVDWDGVLNDDDVCMVLCSVVVVVGWKNLKLRVEGWGMNF